MKKADTANCAPSNRLVKCHSSRHISPENFSASTRCLRHARQSPIATSRDMVALQKHLYVILVSLAILATYLTTKGWRPIFNPLASMENLTAVFAGIPRSFQPHLPPFQPVINNRTPGHDDKVIYFLGLFEMNDENGVEREEARSEVEAAKLAVRDVNSKDVLPGYFIKLLINDTKCDPGVGIDAFFHAIYSNKKIVMLLGSGCSNVSESLAHIVVYWNILQVSFGSTSPNLSDRNEFPFFFRTVSPDSSFNPARTAFMKYYGWETVAAFCESNNVFLLPLNNLVTILENANITCSTITFSLDNYKEQLSFLKSLDTRIIIGSFSVKLAPKIMCEIFELKMFGSDYVWLLQEPDDYWWDNPIYCPKKIVMEVIEGFIFISDYSFLSENVTSISGLTQDSFYTNLNSLSISKYAKFAYDAIWCMSLSLRRVKDLFGDEQILDQFDYNNGGLSEEFVYAMNSLDFMGVSGPIKFSGGDRMGNAELKQIQHGELRRIAIYYTSENYLDFNCANCCKIFWKGGQLPIARRVFKTRLITIPKVIFYIISTLCAAGIIVCLIFLYLNLRYRMVMSFKMSSPKLNTVAVIGCILVYLAAILLGIDKSVIKNEYFTKLCTFKVYLLSAGFTLVFGSMFAKTYRVHRIFTYGSANLVKDKILKDKQLIGLIMLLLLIDGIIITFWVYIDPLHRQLKNLTIEISPINRGVLYQTQVEVCGCNNTKGWFLAIYGYKGFLLIMGVYMAWETRNVKIQALNESQYIGICVYSAVSSAIVVFLSNFLSQDIIISYIATTSSILVSTTITLFLLFLPKLREVFAANTNEEDPVMQSMGLKFECNTRRMIQPEDRNELCLRMEIQNKVYRNEIDALDKEISRLENLLLNGYDVAIIEPNNDEVKKNLNLKSFKSENTLQDHFSNRLCSHPSWLNILQNIKNVKPSSNPEINTSLKVKEENIIRASSISIISKEFNENAFLNSK
nr:gamma-aminobutyric acid type B receptor subunit 2 [Onthophagus taurus]XP_022908052.1 gamma-aminobutyric acid type B receptor subunit 2 [Onthophagus taurus]